MTLKDLQRPKPGMSRAGKIRLGYMMRKCTHCQQPTKAKLEKCEKCGKKNPSPARNETYPTSTPFFVLDDVPELAEIYGNQATRLNIWFAFDSIDEVIPAAYKLHSSSSVLCVGDGEKINYAINAQTGKPVVKDGIALVDFAETGIDNKPIEFGQGEVVGCPGYQKGLYKKCSHCRIEAPLRFMIREMPRFVFYEIGTGSIHNYMNLVQQLSYFAAPKSEGGMGISLKGIPFFLSLVKQFISVPNLDRNGNPKKGEPPKKRVDKHLLNLEIDPEYMMRLAEAQRRLANPARLLLGTGHGGDDIFTDEDAMSGDPETVIYMSPKDVIEVEPEVQPETTPEPPLEPEAAAKPEEPTDKWTGLDKVTFFNQAKDTFGLEAAVTGYILKDVLKLINGNGYEPNYARSYADALSDIGVQCQNFVDHVLNDVLYFTTAKAVIEAMVTLKVTYSQEDEENIYHKLVEFAEKAADAKLADKEEIPF